MSVAQILNSKGREIVSLPPMRKLGEAVTLMAKMRIGAVMILDGGEIAGILSERDIVRAIADYGPEALDHAISRHMTAEVVSAREVDEIQAIMVQMTLGKFRHMPVLEGARLVGIVSIGDIVKQRLADIEAEAQAMREYITA